MICEHCGENKALDPGLFCGICRKEWLGYPNEYLSATTGTLVAHLTDLVRRAELEAPAFAPLIMGARYSAAGIHEQVLRINQGKPFTEPLKTQSVTQRSGEIRPPGIHRCGVPTRKA